MRHIIIILLLSLLTVSCFAQNTSIQNTPRWELSAGYQYLRADTNGVQKLADSLTNSFSPPLPRINVGSSLSMSGGNLAIEDNFKSWVGGVFDFGASYGNRHIDLSQVAQDLGFVPPGTTVTATFRPVIYTFTGGPQFHYRKHERVQPFARVLLGAAHSDVGPDGVTKRALDVLAPSFKTTRNSFAAIPGVGVDYVWKRYAAFRVAGDYVRTYLYDQHQSNFRLTAGVDFRFGHGPDTGF